MSDKINMYKKLVIMPIEEKRNKLRKEILKENIFTKSKDWFIKEVWLLINWKISKIRRINWKWK